MAEIQASTIRPVLQRIKGALALALRPVAIFCGSTILLDDCVMDWFFGFPVPHEGCFTLVGDPDGGNFIGGQTRFL